MQNANAVSVIRFDAAKFNVDNDGAVDCGMVAFGSDHCVNYTTNRFDEDAEVDFESATPFTGWLAYTDSQQYALGIILNHDKESALRESVTDTQIQDFMSAQLETSPNYLTQNAARMGLAVYPLKSHLNEDQMARLMSLTEKGAGNAFAIALEDGVGTVQELFSLALVHCSKKDLAYLMRAPETRKARNTYTAARLRVFADLVAQWFDAHAA